MQVVQSIRITAAVVEKLDDIYALQQLLPVMPLHCHCTGAADERWTLAFVKARDWFVEPSSHFGKRLDPKW